ncbi:MAG: PAS domain-containing sensor histidine kinase [Desulfomonilia bacterium]|nr:PAS domain S-box protein [Desulfomonilia bacterium]
MHRIKRHISHAKQRKVFFHARNMRLDSLNAGIIHLDENLRKLRESQIFLSTLMNNLPGMAYRCRNDKDWTMEFVSKGCLDLTGHRPEELEENRVLSYGSLIHPDDRASVWEEIQKALLNRCSFRISYRIKAADSCLKWVWEQGQGIFSSRGGVVAVEGFIADITEHKEIEERLLKSEQLLDQKVKTRTKALSQVVEELKEQKEILQTVIDHIPAMLIFSDPQGKIRLINREMERVFGWSLEDARTMDLVPRVFPDEQMRKAVSDAIREGRSDWLELEAVTRSGETHPCLWTHVRLSDGSVIGIGIDISARRKMEQDLQRLAFSIEQAGEGIVLLSPDWVIEYVNPAFERISGYSRRELIGRKVDCIKENFLNAQSREEFNRTLAQGRTWSSHQRRQNKSDEMVEADLTVSPVRDEKGQTVNYVSVVRDVTREIALSRRMSQNQKLEAIGTLAGGIAHDLKNIFTPIVLNAEIALMDLETGHPVSSLIREIQEAARMGSDLTRQIVTFSRRNLKEKTPVQITALIEEALSFLRSALPTTIVIHPRLSAGNVHVLADPTQIKQVMLNLGNNAGYAMRKHGGELVVELARETLSAQQASGISPGLAPGPYARITVRDTGEGIDEAVMQRIFDPFFTTKDKTEGTGMGLSVVHGIVRDHQGAVTVQSEPGRGSAFTVYLPEVKGSAPGKNKPTSRPAR